MAGVNFEDVTATFDSGDIEKNKAVAALSVIPFLFWLPFVAAKDSRFAMFYGNQGLILTIVSIAAGIFNNIPWVGWLLGLACELYLAVSVIMGLVNGFQGKAKKLLWLGEIEILK
ncbi:MAG: hypothetical protein VB111_07955 [Clostridiaceae bacterium]|nr:hypothetical protein [Clostridiaceae bacterium]